MEVDTLTVFKKTANGLEPLTNGDLKSGAFYSIKIMNSGQLVAYDVKGRNRKERRAERKKAK